VVHHAHADNRRKRRFGAGREGGKAGSCKIDLRYEGMLTLSFLTFFFSESVSLSGIFLRSALPILTLRTRICKHQWLTSLGSPG
jgi:hypothetical protein